MYKNKTFKLFILLSISFFPQKIFSKSPLIDAVKRGSIVEVDALLKGKVDVDSKDQLGRSALHVASMLGLDGMVEFLIKYGADVNAVDKNGSTSLNAALMWFGRDDVIKKLLAAGADPNIKDNHGLTPLFYASTNSHKSIVEILLSYGAEGIDEILSFAIMNRRKKVVSLCLSCGADVEKEDANGRSYLHKAVISGDLDIVDIVLKNGGDVDRVDFNGFTPLREAVQRGHVEIVALLVEDGADIHDENFKGNTLLHDAVWYSRGDCEVEKYKAIAEILIEAGVYVNVRDQYERTPLHVAAICGASEIARVLLDNGAAPVVQDENGSLPITYARTYKGFGVYASPQSYGRVIGMLEQ
jgi:cytohesin